MKGFDHDRYIKEQSQYILERVHTVDKLYLEFGGKLMYDLHAKRVLPGFDENAKIKLLHSMRDMVEVIICLYAGDIERNKIRSDFNTTYDVEVFKSIDELRRYDLLVNSVVITRYEEGQAGANLFINKLERRGIRVYKHKATLGYPTDVDTIVSDQGYGSNPYIETSKKIVVVTAPGPGSGKLATCLCQLYHDTKKGISVGYSKFETFPVWNVPLKHPLNIAYEAATVDLKDVNMIDPYHLEAYGKVAVNYNRDIEAFPLLKRIIERITGVSVYNSPTDMGVNCIHKGITDNEAVVSASKQEIIRRYFASACDYKKGYIDKEAFQRSRIIMEELGLKEEDRPVVVHARQRLASLKKQTDNFSVVALELGDLYLTGKGSELMDATAALILNAVKQLANINDDIHLISPVVLEPILKLKKLASPNNSPALSCEEVLIALSICAVTNPIAQVAIGKLEELKGCQAHSTTILRNRDEMTLKNLGIDITCDAEFPTDKLYYI